MPLPEASPQPTIVFGFMELLSETEDEVEEVDDPVPVMTVSVGRSETAPLPVVEVVRMGGVRVIVVLEMTMME
jgi:hypothetical protein